MVGVYLDGKICIMAVVSPYLLAKDLDDGEKFFFVYCVVAFVFVKLSGVECNRV